MACNAVIVNRFQPRLILRELLLNDLSDGDRVAETIFHIILKQTNDKGLAFRVADKIVASYLNHSTFDPKTRLIFGLCRAIAAINGQISDYTIIQEQRKSEDNEVIALKTITRQVFPELDDEGLNIVTRWVLRSSKRRPRQIMRLGAVTVFRHELVRICKYVDGARGRDDQNGLFAGWINDLFHQDNSSLSIWAKINNFSLAVKILTDIARLIQRGLAAAH